MSDRYNSLSASFWVMVIVQTIGAVDMPGSGPRKMPAPRQYVPVIIVWSGLQLFADTGRERAAGAAGWVMVLVGMVLGPFGNKLIGLLKAVANQFGVAPSGSASTTPNTPNPIV